ncbi:DNA polymerase III subunit alpha [bacterium]|nr:DNA polymerase III subunit alpha [bacterium]
MNSGRVPFVHLHSRSEYSLLRSGLRMRDLVRLAAAHRMPAVALTDVMNMHACVSFHDQCYREGVKPILGAEIALEPVVPAIDVDPQNPTVFELVILAEDYAGYQRLCEALTRAHLDAGAVTPRVATAWFEELAGKWIVLSGGAGGEVFRHLAAGERGKARDAAAWLAHASGPGRFFLELQWHKLPEERTVLPALVELSKQLAIPTVATNQCAYAAPADASTLELLARIRTGSAVSSIDDLAPASDQFHFKSHEEMADAFRNLPEAIANTVAIADRCAVELPVGKGHLMPAFDAPGGMQNRAYFEQLCLEGLRARYPDWESEDAAAHHLTKKKRAEIEKRLAFETETIVSMGFINYFLIVADFVRHARQQGIPVGPGRGSAAGSLVSYLLGITDVDPLDFGLVFERFLNPARRKMPDIDMDFCERRRPEVIEYVRTRYGRDRVAQIATFSTMRARAAVRDTGRILGTPAQKVERVCALLGDHYRGHPHLRFGVIADALDKHEPLREAYREDRDINVLIEFARRIEDMPRNLSTHAAGIVIGAQPLRTLLPLARSSDGEALTQVDMFGVERLGLLKMDLLGLTNLTIIDDALKLIRDCSGESVTLAAIPLDDAPTYRLLQRADMLGIFQLESAGMRRLARDIGMESFNDVIALVALYRPGPMPMRDTYVRRKHGVEPVAYPHEKLEPILKETYGIMLYQEQVMQCLHSLLGYSLADADIFRDIMSKKLADRIPEQKAQFMQRAAKKNLDPGLAETLFEDIARFSGYGFNKSHATAYALVAYWTAYLKANRPAAFFAALMAGKLQDEAKLAEIASECRARRIPLLPPDVNQSSALFTVERGAGAIRCGLAAIRNVGPQAVGELLSERSAHGPFNSIDDLCLRIDRRTVSRKVVDSLVKAGACDSFGIPRQRLSFIADDITAGWERGAESELQRSFFDAFDTAATALSPTRAKLDAVGEWDVPTRLAFEKEMLGFYVSGHPLDAIAPVWRALSTADARQTGFQPEQADDAGDTAEFFAEQRRVVMGGLVTATDWRKSRKGTSYGILSIGDFYGTSEALIWSELFDKYRARVKQGSLWFLEGTLKRSFNRVSLWTDRLAPAGEAIEQWPDGVRIRIGEAHANEGVLEALASVFARHKGPLPVDLVFVDEKGEAPVVRLPDEQRVAPSQELIAGIESLFGEGCVSFAVP